MKFFSVILLLLAFIYFPLPARAGEDVMNKVTEGVCNCLESCKQDNTSVKSKQFQSCVQKATKDYVKQLKKMYMDKDDPDEMKFASTIAMKLAMTMASQCPAMLEFIMEEFPGLMDGN